MRFARPELLWLLPIVIWFWRSSRTAARTAPASTRAWRSMLALLVVLSAGGLQLGWVESPVALMFVLDRSHSVAAGQTELVNRVQEFAPHMRRGDRAGLVAFGRTAVVERALGPAVDARIATAEIAPTGTNIETALRVARASLPAGQARRLVLLSDGLQTSGDALAEAARAAIDNVRIDVVIPPESKSASRLENPPCGRSCHSAYRRTVRHCGDGRWAARPARNNRASRIGRGSAAGGDSPRERHCRGLVRRGIDSRRDPSVRGDRRISTGERFRSRRAFRRRSRDRRW